MSFQLIKTGPVTWTLGRVKRGEALRDRRFSPVCSLEEAEVLFSMEKRSEQHRRQVRPTTRRVSHG